MTVGELIEALSTRPETDIVWRYDYEYGPEVIEEVRDCSEGVILD